MGGTGTDSAKVFEGNAAKLELSKAVWLLRECCNAHEKCYECPLNITMASNRVCGTQGQPSLWFKD